MRGRRTAASAETKQRVEQMEKELMAMQEADAKYELDVVRNLPTYSPVATAGCARVRPCPRARHARQAAKRAL